MVTLTALGGGNAGATPFPDMRTMIGEVVAALPIETVPLSGAVAVGENTTLKEVVPEGGTTTGRRGRFAVLKKFPLTEIDVTVTGLSPVLLKVMTCVDDVKIETFPNESGFGLALRPNSGTAAAENVTGLPVMPRAAAVTVFVPAVEPRVRTAEAWP